MRLLLLDILRVGDDFSASLASIGHTDHAAAIGAHGRAEKVFAPTPARLVSHGLYPFMTSSHFMASMRWAISFRWSASFVLPK